MENVVDYQKKENCGLLTICRPKALNALNQEVLEALDQVLDGIEEDSELRVLMITGSGDKAFVAGADIKEIHDLNRQTAMEFSRKGQKVFERIEKLPMAVIAAVNGFALGGGLELALACDFIYASEKAKFGLPECTLGLIPGFGGTVRLSRKVPSGLAREWTMTGSMVSAEEALTAGLVNKVCDHDTMMEQVLTVASVLQKRAPLAIRGIKKCIQETYGLPVTSAMDVEAKAFAQLFTSWDAKEGTSAFIEKRKPVFKGQ